MYKLIIVDDEEEIRQGLSEFIDWNEIGFELVASFEDGKETIEYLQNNDVDVVLTDILMAEVSGLELAEYIYKNKLNVNVIILSGYKEFEYAKKAIEFNVDKYLLKPTDIDEIACVFTEIKEKLSKENEIRLEQRKIKEHYEKILPMIEEQFFTDLLMGGLRSETQIKKRIASIGLNIDPNTNPCIIAKIDIISDDEFQGKWVHGKERLHLAIKNFFRFSKEGIRYFSVFYDNRLRVIAVASHITDIKTVFNDVNNHLEEVLETMKKCLGVYFKINIQHQFNSLTEISKHREPVKIHYNSNVEEDNYHFEPEVYKQLLQKHKLFVSVISEGNYETLMNLSDNYIDEIESLPIRFIHRLIGDLFTILFNKLSEIGLKFEGVAYKKTDYTSISRYESIEDIRTMVKEVFTSLLDYAAQEKQKTTDTAVNLALKYIGKNYNKDISLEDVSNEVFLNSVYFSRLFKQQIGENFIDYLTKMRMEKAIELIGMKKYKTYEISDMVGYSSSKYFSRVFKLYTGYVPKDYIKIIR